MVEKKSAFDIAVEEAKAGTTFDRTTQQGVALLLQTAGVAQAKITEILANPSQVALIVANPSLAEKFAQMFPSTYAINYYEARTQLGFGRAGEPEERPIEEIPAYERAAVQHGLGAPTRTPTGAMEYEGGVLVDPVNQVVYFPPNDASLAGSPAWMALIPQWSEEKQKTWAKTLFDNGYLDTKNPNLVDLQDALREYHETRYLYGGGKPVDLSKGDAGVKKEDFGAILDPAVLRSEVRTWFEEAYGDQPSDDEADFFADKLKNVALRLARKRKYEPADAAAAAQARVQERFMGTPEAKEFQRQAEEEEENTELRDSLLSVSQIIGGSF